MKRNLALGLRSAALQRGFSHNERHTLSFNRSLEVAQKRSLSLRSVEIESLLSRVIPERYSRNIPAIGIEGQIKLLKSQVTIVGVGGLGGTVLEHLVRLGVGKIRVIDGDDFIDSNLNRQILCNCRNLGKSKVLEAKRRVKRVNPAVEVRCFDFAANKGNLIGLIQNSHVVVDGLDDIQVRFVLEEACQQSNVPFVHAAVAGFVGQVTTIFPDDVGLKRIYGAGRHSKRGIEKQLGIISITPAIVAAIQVSEVIKVLLGWPGILQNRLLFVDLQKPLMEIIELT
jgi:molybdopterin/thiamine biosynthesis adenylyltransferase